MSPEQADRVTHAIVELITEMINDHGKESDSFTGVGSWRAEQELCKVLESKEEER